MKIKCFNDLVKQARGVEKKAVVAVVEAHDENTMESVVRAAGEGIIRPLLIGRAEEIGRALLRFGEKPAEYEIVPSGDADESIKKAVELINTGQADALMKGSVETAPLMRAVVARENGLLEEGRQLSLVGLYETEKYHKLFAVSDMGINISPDLETKRAIIENAVRLLRAIGVTEPKVAVLSAVEKVNPKMQDTLDADALKAMNMDGRISGCIVEGPISFDLATSYDAARIKGYESPVAGDADALIVPEITSGNILVKCLTSFGGARTAGTVIGARVPVILPSRSAEAEDKYYSIALAACAALRV